MQNRKLLQQVIFVMLKKKNANWQEDHKTRDKRDN